MSPPQILRKDIIDKGFSCFLILMYEGSSDIWKP